MKKLFIFALTALMASPALACTKTEPKAASKLIRMFQLSGSSVDWISVSTRTNSDTKQTTVRKNRSFPLTVQADRRLNRSKIIYKRDTYDLSEAKVCAKGKSILIVHPKGELVVRRRGKDLKTSEISIKQNGSLFKLRLRPEQLLGSKRSVIL